MAGVSSQTKYPRRQAKAVCPTFLSVAGINTTTRNNVGMEGSISSSTSLLHLPGKPSQELPQLRNPESGSETGHGGTCLLTCSLWPFQFTFLSNQVPPAEGWHCPPLSLINQQHVLLLCLQASLMETIFNVSSFFADDSNVCQTDQT